MWQPFLDLVQVFGGNYHTLLQDLCKHQLVAMATLNDKILQILVAATEVEYIHNNGHG